MTGRLLVYIILASCSVQAGLLLRSFGKQVARASHKYINVSSGSWDRHGGLVFFLVGLRQGPQSEVYIGNLH